MATGHNRNERGASMVELVLVVPFLFGVIFLLISYGVMASFRQTMSQAAVEGARAAAVSPERDASGTPIDRVAVASTTVSDSFAGQIGSPLTCTGGALSPVSGSVCTVTTESCPNDSAYQCIKVYLQYPYRASPRVVLSNYFGAVLPATLTYTARARIS